MTLGSIPSANLNLYRYVENNPVNYIDGSGMVAIGHLSRTKQAVWQVKRTLAEIRLMVGIVAHVAKRELIKSGKVAKEIVKNHGPCGLAFAAGFTKSELNFDTMSSEDDVLRKTLKFCYTVGQGINALLNWKSDMGG